MNKILYPDYINNIISIPATILNHFGIKNDKPKNILLESELKRDYKNIIFCIFDGLGTFAVKKLSHKKEFLKSNYKSTLSSVFPPTTTAATVAYNTANYPAEHGWIGWKLYFKEIDEIVDIFRNKKSYTQEPLKQETKIIADKYPQQTIYNILEDEAKEVRTITVNPVYVDECAKENYIYNSTEKQFEIISKLCKEDGKKVIFSYNDRPDCIMHDEGSTSEAAKNEIKKINEILNNFSKNMENTLIIISADHGQINVKKSYLLSDNEELCQFLVRPPSIESRCLSLFVIKDKREEFKKKFIKHYGKDFLLFSKEEIVNKKLFGPTETQNYLEFIGDYVAIAKKNAIMQFKTPGGVEPDIFKGHHAGLTKYEMEVPLIFRGKKETN